MWHILHILMGGNSFLFCSLYKLVKISVSLSLIKIPFKGKDENMGKIGNFVAPSRSRLISVDTRQMQNFPNEIRSA
jgi:hypothetical protein